MNAKQKIHQAMLQQWASRFTEQKASGLTIRQWCEQNNYSIHKYNYWKHLLKEEVTDQLLPDIVPLCSPAQMTVSSVSPDNPASPFRANCTNRVMVRFIANDISFEVAPDIPEAFLCSLMKAVRHA